MQTLGFNLRRCELEAIRVESINFGEDCRWKLPGGGIGSQATRISFDVEFPSCEENPGQSLEVRLCTGDGCLVTLVSDTTPDFSSPLFESEGRSIDMVGVEKSGHVPNLCESGARLQLELDGPRVSLYEDRTSGRIEVWSFSVLE